MRSSSASGLCSESTSWKTPARRRYDSTSASERAWCVLRAQGRERSAALTATVLSVSAHSRHDKPLRRSASARGNGGGRDSAEEVCSGRHDQLGARPGPRRSSPRTTAAGTRSSCPSRARQRRRSRRRARSRSSELVAGRIVAGRARSRSTSIPAAPIATFAIPRRHERPNVSVTITPSERPVRSSSPARRAAAEASGSSGSRTTVSGAGAFEASTPADAQTNPWRSRRSRAAAGCGRRAPTRAGSPRAGAGRRRPASRRPPPTARPRRGGRRAPRPSRRPSGRRRRRRRPRARPRPAISAARSSPSAISGSPSTGSRIARASPRVPPRGRPRRAGAPPGVSVISVRVTCGRTPTASTAAAPAASARSIDERVDQSRVAARDVGAGSVPPASRSQHRGRPGPSPPCRRRAG